MITIEPPSQRFETFKKIIISNNIPMELRDKILTSILQDVLNLNQLTNLLLSPKIEPNYKAYILSKIDLSVNVSLPIPKRLPRARNITTNPDLCSISFDNYPDQYISYIDLHRLLVCLENQGVQINTFTSSEYRGKFCFDSQKDNYFILQRLLKLAKFHKSRFHYVASIDYLALDHSFDSISVEVRYHSIYQPFPFERYRKLQRITLQTSDLMSRDTNSLLIGVSGAIKSGIPLTTLVIKFDYIYHVFDLINFRFFLYIIQSLLPLIDIKIERKKGVEKSNYDEPSLLFCLLKPIKHLFKSTYLEPDFDLVSGLSTFSNLLELRLNMFTFINNRDPIPPLVSSSLKSLAFHAFRKYRHSPIELNLMGIPQLQHLLFSSWNIDSKTFDNLPNAVKEIQLSACKVKGIFHLPPHLQILKLVNTFPKIDSFLRSHYTPGINLTIENRIKLTESQSKYNHDGSKPRSMFFAQLAEYLSVVGKTTSTINQLAIKSSKQYYFTVSNTSTIDHPTSFVIEKKQGNTGQTMKEFQLDVVEYGCCVKQTLLHVLFRFFMEELNPAKLSEKFEERLVRYFDDSLVEHLDIDYTLTNLSDAEVDNCGDAVTGNGFAKSCFDILRCGGFGGVRLLGQGVL